MAEVIDFDEKCRARDVKRYTATLYRRASARIKASEEEHNAIMESCVAHNEKVMRQTGIVLLAIFFVGAAICLWFIVK